MSDQTVTIGVAVEGGDEGASQLGKVTTAAQQMGAAVGGAAQGFDAASASSSKLTTGQQNLIAAFVREAEEIRSSNDSLEVQRLKLEALRSGLEEQIGNFIRLGEGGRAAANAVGDELQKVRAQLADVASGTRDAVARLREIGSAGKDAAGGVEAAGAAAGNAETSIAGASANVEKALGKLTEGFDRFDKTVENGSPRILQQFDRLVILQSNLRREIVSTYGSIEQAPAAIAARYSELSARVDSARGHVRELRFELAEQNRELDVAGYRFTTLGQAIQDSVGGKGAQAVGILAAIGLAAKTSFEKTIEIEDKLGVPLEAYKEKLEDVRRTIGTAVSEIDNAGAATINLGYSLASADFERAGKDIIDYVHSLEKASVALTSSGRELRGLDTLIDLHISTVEKLKFSEEEVLRLGDLRARYAAEGKEGERQWAEAVRQNANDHAALIAALERGIPQLDAYHKRVEENVKAIDEENRERKKHIDLLQSEIDAVSKTIEVIDREAKAFGTASAAREHLFDTQKKLVDELAKLDVAQNGTTDSIRTELETLSKLTSAYEANEPAIRKVVAALDASRDATVGLSEAEKKRIAEIGDSVKAIDNLRAKNEELKKEVTDLLLKGDQLTKAEVADIEAKNREIVANQGLIESTKEKIKADAEARNQIVATSGATAELTRDLETGKATISNVGDAAETSSIKVDKLHRSATNVGDSTVKATGSLKDGTVVITNVGDAAEGADSHVDALGKHVGTLSIAASDAKDPVASLKSVIDDLVKGLKENGSVIRDELRPQVAELTAEWKKATDQVTAYNEAVHRATEQGSGTPQLAPGNPYPNVSESP